jgi:hypothetical protein
MTKKRPIDERTKGDDTKGTPGWLIDRIAIFARHKRIGLDPAGGATSLPASQRSAHVYRLPKQDGLRDPWRGFGTVFCNPPYGRIIGKWIAWAIEQFSRIEGYGVDPHQHDELLMLVAARVNSRWFRKLFRAAPAVLYFDRRLCFIGEVDDAKFPSALVYFGERAATFAEHFGDLGTVIYTYNSEVNHDPTATTRRAIVQFPDHVGVRNRRLPGHPSRAKRTATGRSQNEPAGVVSVGQRSHGRHRVRRVTR